MATASSNHGASFYLEHNARMDHMKSQAPDVARSFGSMFVGLMKDNTAAGGLSVRDKELIALAIGVATHCEPCIYSHVHKLHKLGATRQQALDAAGVAVMMGGGPAYTHVPMVVEAWDALEPPDGAKT